MKAIGTPALSHWPVQLHLINNADSVIAADCAAFALGSFHLDSGREIYLSKLTSIISQAKSVKVVVRGVHCWSVLLRLVREARTIHSLVVGIDGSFVTRNSDWA